MVPLDERARSPPPASLGCRLHLRRTTGRLVQPCRPPCPRRHLDAREYRHVAGGVAGRSPTGSRAAGRNELGKLTAKQGHALPDPSIVVAVRDAGSGIAAVGLLMMGFVADGVTM